MQAASVKSQQQLVDPWAAHGAAAMSALPGRCACAATSPVCHLGKVILQRCLVVAASHLHLEERLQREGAPDADGCCPAALLP